MNDEQKEEKPREANQPGQGLLVLSGIILVSILLVYFGKKDCRNSWCHRMRQADSPYCIICEEKQKRVVEDEKTYERKSTSSSTQGTISNTYGTTYNASGVDTSNSGKTNKTQSSTGKQYSMPDCDDYEDFDEFMDEWDGFMPDGSDAEDYWENW